MRIAFITHYTSLYGANRSLLNLMDGLQKFGVTPYVIVPEVGEITQVLSDRKIPFAIIPLQFWISIDKEQCFLPKPLDRFLRSKYNAVKHLWRNLRLLPNLIECLKEWEIDLIYTNSGVTPIGALAANKLKIPHIWHLREFIDLDYNFRHDWGKSIFCYFFRQASAQIVVSKALGSHFFADSLPKTLHTIYNGVASTSYFDQLYQQVQTEVQLEPQLDKVYTFAIVGRVHPNKGQDTAIKALAQLVSQYPEVRLLIAGNGNLKPLESLVQELDIENKVEFLGYIDDPYQVYTAADAVLMCSPNEAMGRVTVEAMAACCPVIGYDNGGTSELIDHRETGLLYQGDEAELAKYMLQLVENQKWSQKLGQNAFFNARERFSIESYAQSVYDVIQDVSMSKE